MPNDGPIRSLKHLRQTCQSHRGWNRLDRIQLSGNLDTARSGLQVKLVELFFQISRRPRIFKRTLPLPRSSSVQIASNLFKWIFKYHQGSNQCIMHTHLRTHHVSLIHCVHESSRRSSAVSARVVPLAVAQHHLHRAVPVFCPICSWHIDWLLLPARTAPCWDSRCKHKMPRG